MELKIYIKIKINITNLIRKLIKREISILDMRINLLL